MKTEKQYFDDAISLKNYMNQMKNHKENSQRIYEQFECPKDDEFIERLKTAKPNILVITEDWCGDAMMNNAILLRIAEAADLDVRAVYRDEDTSLIDRHLTNGGQSIPKYLLLGKDGAVAAEWGPRASQLGGYVLKLKESLPSNDSPDYSEKQNEFISRITAEYTTKPEFWLAVYEDIRKTFLPVVQNV